MTVKMAENGPQPLTADQREEIRRMLCRFGGVMEEEKSIVPVQEEVKEFQLKEIADVFNKAPSGTTVELNALTTGSYRYHIVRIGVSLFKPLILDDIRVTKEELVELCKNEMGVEMHAPTAGMLTGAVEQAEPIVMFQIELKEPAYDTIKTIRWMT